jgi:hypothetical protein
MARLNARWFNFTKRGQTWDRFWQDAGIATGGTASVIDAGGIASAEAFGADTFNDHVAAVDVGGIASAEAIGAPTVTHLGGTTDLQGGGAWRNPPHFRPPFEPYTPFVVPMWVKVRGAGGIESAEAFGRPSVASRRGSARRRREEELLAA